MENAGTAPRESAVPEGTPGVDKNSIEQRRNIAGYAIGVASGIGTFVLEILQFSPLFQRLLSCFVAIALAIVIAEGVKAWPVIRQYRIMLAGVAVAFVCLGSLAVAVPQGVQSATGGGRVPYAPSSSARDLSGVSPHQSPAVASVSSNTPSTSSGNSPAGSDGYTVEYTGQEFSIPGGGCVDNSYVPYVLFTARAPYSDANDYDPSLGVPDGTYDNGAYDIYLDCFHQQIGFYGQAAAF